MSSMSDFEDGDESKPPKKLHTPGVFCSDLLVTKATPTAIVKFVPMINGNFPEPTAQNQSLPPRIRSLTDLAV